MLNAHIYMITYISLVKLGFIIKIAIVSLYNLFIKFVVKFNSYFN